MAMVLGTQAQKPSMHAIAISTSPRIDGQLDDVCWQSAPTYSGFKQNSPWYNAEPANQTIVQVVFDNEGVYFAIQCLDSSPDSIYHQLGGRDESLNADQITLKIDPYALGQDAYVFSVFASGPQMDYRFQDESFNAVWYSEVKIGDGGWVVEIKIPYSALRFPKKDMQNWSIQVERQLRRSREISQWALEEKGADNIQMFWGSLSGIKNIDPPLRLSLNPYFSTGISHYPYHTEGVSNLSYSIGGGLDLKLGLSESFTLDMTLLPDFSQVQSDDPVKNLSAFETTYEEQRLFFKEGIDLFNSGDLFYSRRIGREPMKMYEVLYEVDSNEVLLKNPSQAKLLNAFKISGRTRSGLGIGFFNAITDNTYAVILDSSGTERKMLTEPFTNYNIVVLDQSFKNQNSVYLINTNVTRPNGYTSANVSGCGLTLNDKTSSYQFSIAGSLSSQYDDFSSDYALPKMGTEYSTMFSKTRGRFRFYAYRNAKNEKYDINDLGLNFTNNEENTGSGLTWMWLKPFWKILKANNSISIDFTNRMDSKKLTNSSFSYNFNLTTMKYFTMWGWAGHSFTETYNYYEPRVDGYYYMEPHWFAAEMGFSSNYSKPFALDGGIEYVSSASYGSRNWEISLDPIFKIGNRIQFDHELSYYNRKNDMGFASITDEGAPLFGMRQINSISNTFTGKFVIRNYMQISLRARHYWYEGIYNAFFPLNANGSIGDEVVHNQNENFNFNTFNIDLVFSWNFSPGSVLNIVWKNSIINENQTTAKGYSYNLSKVFNQDQLNSLTLKLVYYIDYLQVKNRLSKHQ